MFCTLMAPREIDLLLSKRLTLQLLLTLVQEERKHIEADFASTQYLGLLPFSQCATILHSSHERIIATGSEMKIKCRYFEPYQLYFVFRLCNLLTSQLC